MAKQLYTIGYSRWSGANRLEKMVAELRDHNITLLVDVRLSPAASSLSEESIYGPKAWSLQPAGRGIESHLNAAGIGYLWLSELGNPQKNDPSHTIMQQHILESDEPWPVHRGLKLLYDKIESGERVALLCTCATYETCHRKQVAEALKDLYYHSDLEIQNITD